MKHILIAEDEKPIARALALKLSHAGYDVTTVNNGEEAVDATRKKAFDLILLDLIMPKKDGFAALEEWRREGSTIPVIVTSNLGQDEDAAKARALGASDYLIKSNTSLAGMVDHIQHFFKE